MRRIWAWLKLGSLGVSLLFSGCAATQAALQLSKANKAVDRAKAKGAPEYAIYEYTMAENYLEKAREEAGYSDFKDSVMLSQGAAEWADKAIIVIEEEGRGLDLETLPGETRTLTEEDRSTGEAPVSPDDPESPLPEEPTSVEEEIEAPQPVPDAAPTDNDDEEPDKESNETDALPDMLLPPSQPPPKGEAEPKSGDGP